MSAAIWESKISAKGRKILFFCTDGNEAHCATNKNLFWDNCRIEFMVKVRPGMHNLFIVAGQVRELT